MDTPFSRRQVLTAAAAGSAALMVGGKALGATPDLSLPQALADASPKNPGSDLGAVKHIVFMMQENRSFDHVFGSLKGVRGFDDRSHNAARVFKQKLPNGGGNVYPYRYNTDTQDASCTFGPQHEWAPMQRQYNNGRPNFVRSQIHTQTANPEVTGPMTMGYYTRKDLPFYYALADAFTMCDRYFCSALGPTHPNRTYAISGTIDPAGKHGGPCISTVAGNFQKFSWTTVQELLEDAGVSWKVYAPTQPPQNFGTGGPALVAGNNILMAFKQFGTPGTALYNQAFTNDWPGQFLADVANNKLPAVSWVWPGAVPGMDDHPAAPMARGEYGTNVLLQALFKNKKLWAKTLVIHTYDEHGAYFDHVVPPVAPKGTAGEFLTVNPLPEDAEGHSGPIGMGFRVPATIISPWSRGGYVSSQRYDHVSQLLLLEERFGIRVKAISKWRRNNTGDLTGPLRFSTKNTVIPNLPSAPLTPTKVAEQCAPISLNAELGGTQLPYPTKQTMPNQEKGTKRVVKNGKRVRSGTGNG